MQAQLLLFNFPKDRADALRLAAAPRGVACREVLPAEHRTPLRALLETPRPAPSPLSSPAFTAPMLVFSGLDRSGLDPLLDLIRPLTGGVLKAVVTPFNLSWTGEALFKELSEEHRRFLEKEGR